MSLLLTEAPTEDLPLYRVTADQFDVMIEAGAFPDGARVELINGVLVEMSPIGPGHDFIVRQVNRLFQRVLPDWAVIGVQGSLRCGRSSQPEPDLFVARGPDDYVERHPRGHETVLVVEVADSSLRYDRRVKVPLYAKRGVPEVWVVDLRHRKVHVHTDPKDDGYATTATLTTGDTLVPTAFPDVEIPVRDLGLDRLR